MRISIEIGGRLRGEYRMFPEMKYNIYSGKVWKIGGFVSDSSEIALNLACAVWGDDGLGISEVKGKIALLGGGRWAPDCGFFKASSRAGVEFMCITLEYRLHFSLFSGQSNIGSLFIDFSRISPPELPARGYRKSSDRTYLLEPPTISGIH
jgi:hypothetical protein